jgi:hypothetical protein
MNDVRATLAAATLSGGRRGRLERGWALIPFMGRAGHHWTRVPQEYPVIGARGRLTRYHSACGLDATTTADAPPMALGTFPACRLCLKKRPHPTARDRLTLLEDGSL